MRGSQWPPRSATLSCRGHNANQTLTTTPPQHLSAGPAYHCRGPLKRRRCRRWTTPSPVLAARHTHTDSHSSRRPRAPRASGSVRPTPERGTPPGPATCHCCGVAHGFCAPTVFLLSVGVSSAACIVVRSRRPLSVLAWRDWRYSHRVGGAGERTARSTGSMAPKRTFLEPWPACVRLYPVDSVCYYCQRQTGHVVERVAGSAAR